MHNLICTTQLSPHPYPPTPTPTSPTPTPPYPHPFTPYTHPFTPYPFTPYPHPLPLHSLPPLPLHPPPPPLHPFTPYPHPFTPYPHPFTPYPYPHPYTPLQLITVKPSLCCPVFKMWLKVATFKGRWYGYSWSKLPVCLLLLWLVQAVARDQVCNMPIPNQLRVKSAVERSKEVWAGLA